jgi:hypothetical protein
MRLRIDMTGVEFRVAGVAKPRKDWQNKENQATTRDGRPLWTVRLIAFDSGAGSNGSMETIWVEVAGDEPQLIPNEVADVQGLTYAPWVNNKKEIVRAFRAESVTVNGASRRPAA